MLINKVKVLVSTLLAIGAMAMPLPGMAAVDVELNFGPPPPVVEVVPAPRPGYVWSPGYYAYENDRHVWRRGDWRREREGYAYYSNRWVERDGRWRFEGERWERR